MLLHLLRHGIAVDWRDPKCPPDEERPLTPEGVEKTREAAEGMKAIGLNPDAILSSPFARARQTAEIVAEVLEFPAARIARTKALLPSAGVREIFEELAELRAESALCVGHAPNLDDVLAYALRGNLHVTALKKCGLACIELHSISQPNGLLLYHLPPKFLRMLGKSGKKK